MGDDNGFGVIFRILDGVGLSRYVINLGFNLKSYGQKVQP